MDKQKFLEMTEVETYINQLDEKINAKNIAVKGYDWVKNKWRSGFRKPKQNLGGPGVDAWKQNKP